MLRARKSESSDGYSHTADVHYPPASLTKPGRLNEAGQPLLYVSFTQFTALNEIHSKSGDNIHIIGYSTHSDKPIRALILGEYTNVHKRGQCNLSGEVSGHINKILNNMSLEPGLSFIYMDAFLSSILADKSASEFDYLHSRLLAKVLFDKYPQVDAIHYPSVARNGAMNLAIKPHVADSCLTIVSASVLHIDQQFDYGLFRFSVTKNAHCFDQSGRIFWQ